MMLLFLLDVKIKVCGGERGIRTLETLLTLTHFPGVLLQPLGHLTTLHTYTSIQVANFTQTKN